MRLQTKALALFAVSGALLVTLVGVVQSAELKARTLDAISHQIGKQLENLDFALTRFLKDVEEDLIILAADARIRTDRDKDFTSFFSADENTFVYHISPHEQEIIDVFSTFRMVHPHVSSVYMARENGSSVRSHKRDRPTRYDPRLRPWYQLAKEHPGVVSRTPPYRSVASPDVNIGVVTPLLDHRDRFFGVVGADITLAGLTEYVAAFSLSHEGQALLLDEKGVVLASQDRSMLFKNVRSIYPEGHQLMEAEKGGPVLLDGQGGRQYAYVSPSPGTGWRLVALVREQKIQAAIREAVSANVLFLAAAIVLLSLATLVGLYRCILTPVGALTQGAWHIRKTGDLRHRFAEGGRDELQELGGAFNQMLASMEAAEAQRKASRQDMLEERSLLEERVKARTLELEALNRDLAHEVAVRQQAEKACQEANQAKSLFLANMAHDAEKSRDAGMNGPATRPVEPERLMAVPGQGAPLPGAGQALPLGAPPAEALTGYPPELLALGSLDALQGIRRIGGKAEAYRKQLRRFREHYPDAAAELQRLAAEEGAKSAEAYCHALKGVSGNLGATALYATVSAIDALLKQGRLPAAAQLEEMRLRLQEVMADIDSLAVAGSPLPAPPAAPLALGEILARLEHLALALQYDLGAVEAVLGGLRAGTRGHEIEPVLREVAAKTDVFAIDEALDLVSELRQRLLNP